MSRIKIQTRTGGKTAFFEAPARRSSTSNGESICFFDQGDEVVLTVSGQGLSLRRTGERGQSADFREGETTSLCLEMGEGRAFVPLFTRLCRIEAREGGLELRLGYELRFEGGHGRFLLHISVSDDLEEA